MKKITADIETMFGFDAPKKVAPKRKKYEAVPDAPRATFSVTSDTDNLDDIRKQEKRKYTKKRFKSVDHVHYGDEPKSEGMYFIDDTAYMRQLGKCFNWYNSVSTERQWKKWSLEYATTHNFPQSSIDALQEVSEEEFRSAGFLCRTAYNGMELSGRHQEFLTKQFDHLVKLGREIIDRKSERSTKSTNKYDQIQAAMTERRRKAIGMVECEVDRFLENGCAPTDFNIVTWLIEHSISGAYSAAIAERYLKLFAEINSVIEGTDADLQEAYSCYTKKQLKAFLVFLAEIIDACQTRKTVTRKRRTPSKSKKQKPATKVVSKMKFMPAEEVLGIKSIPPEKIVGAEQLWAYNTKNRTLCVFIAKDSSGLSVKGTTVTNFNETDSIRKRLRKPKEILKTVTETGKVGLRKLMDSIRCKPLPIKGRTNDKMLLVRVL